MADSVVSEMQSTRVKICCISSLAEAELVIACGANAIGLVSEMPSGPGVIPEDEIADIAARVPQHVETFLLTSRVDADQIIEQVRRCRVTTLQICDALATEVYAMLRAAIPDVSLVQVIHVEGSEAIGEAIDVSAHVDALLLDSGRPSLDVKELGGTGRTHDWVHSRKIVAECRVPVYLAGGLNASNVGDAIHHVAPYGVDLCSGVRTDERLDETKLKNLMTAVAAANDN